MIPSLLAHSSGTHAQSLQWRLTLRPRGLQPAGLLCPWNSPGQKTGVGCCSFLQGIFLTLGSNLGLWYCRQILYCLSDQRSPRGLRCQHMTKKGWQGSPSRGSELPSCLETLR